MSASSTINVIALQIKDNMLSQIPDIVISLSIIFVIVLGIGFITGGKFFEKDNF